jgi:hypothetical protein
MYLNHIEELMVNVILHHSQDSEKKVHFQHSNVKIINHLCVQTENVLEIKTIVELNYLVKIMVQDVQIKLVNNQQINV